MFSSAINKGNPELREAKRKKIPVIQRVEMLSEIVRLKKNIVISGAHGKTTITSLISTLLSKAKLDPMIINGGILNSINSNALFGKGDWAVVEADESDGSFLKIPITYSVVSNIDKEHLDYYKNFNNLYKSFETFINKTPLLIANPFGASSFSLTKVVSTIFPFLSNLIICPSPSFAIGFNSLPISAAYMNLPSVAMLSI